MDLRRKILFAGHLLLLVGALAASFVAMNEHPDADSAIGVSLDPPDRRRDPVLQLPKVVARSEQGGILVSLRNDTNDRQVFIDPSRNHLLVEYSRTSGGLSERLVAVSGCTLDPGEETEAVFVALSEHAGTAKVEFVHTEYVANTKLIAKSHMTVP